MAYYPPEGREHYKGPSALPSHLLMRVRLHALFLSETCLSAAKSSHAFVPLVDDSGFSLKILYFCLPAAPHPTQINLIAVCAQVIRCPREPAQVAGHDRARACVMLVPLHPPSFCNTSTRHASHSLCICC